MISAAISWIEKIPMKITSVSDWPTLLQSMPATSWPVTNVTTLVCARCVSGTPL